MLLLRCRLEWRAEHPKPKLLDHALLLLHQLEEFDDERQGVGLAWRWQHHVALVYVIPVHGCVVHRLAPCLGCPGPNSGFGRALSDLGYTWGEKVEIVCRSGGGNYRGLSNGAADLASHKVDVIVGLSHIGALARPAGNATGLTYYSTEFGGEAAAAAQETVPGIAVLGNTKSDHVFGLHWDDAARAARTLGLELSVAEFAIPVISSRPSSAFPRRVPRLLVLTDPMLRGQARQIAELAASIGSRRCMAARGSWKRAGLPPTLPTSTP